MKMSPCGMETFSLSSKEVTRLYR